MAEEMAAWEAEEEEEMERYMERDMDALNSPTLPQQRQREPP